MRNKLYIKRIIMLISIFVLFFSFNVEVRAATAGTCEYYNSKAKLYIRLKQDANGKFSYKYKKKKSNNWKKLTSKIKVTSPSGEIKKSCPNSRITKSLLGNYTVKFNVSASGTGDTTIQSAYTDTFHGRFNGKEETKNGTVNGGSGKSSIHSSDGSLNCYYTLNNQIFLNFIQNKKGEKSYKYAYVDEGKNAKWKKYSGSTGSGGLKITDKGNGAYSGCPMVYGLKKTVIVGTCPANTGVNCSSGSGTDPIAARTGKSSTVSGEDLNEINKRLVGDDIETKSCKEILGDELIEKIQEIVNMVRIMIPILLIVFGIIDFGKAIFVSDENEMKKSQSKFIRRLIVAVGFFMVPSILALVLNIANQVWNVIPNAENAFCGIKF